MDTTTIIVIICILAIVGIALLAITMENKPCVITVRIYESNGATMADIKTSPCSKDMDIYIDGEPVSDEFDIKGIDLDKYNIKIKNDTVYLISK
ncbi:hypothetical protein [Butyribacter sp.]|uniref:hypothetical protein n=1 Tax=Butyribacter sp. TaxID=2822465 RepID=UPI002A95D003|nr:hypothetical protein [Butyribacter sp.]